MGTGSRSVVHITYVLCCVGTGSQSAVHLSLPTAHLVQDPQVVQPLPLPWPPADQHRPDEQRQRVDVHAGTDGAQRLVKHLGAHVSKPGLAQAGLQRRLGTAHQVPGGYRCGIQVRCKGQAQAR